MRRIAANVVPLALTLVVALAGSSGAPAQTSHPQRDNADRSDRPGRGEGGPHRGWRERGADSRPLEEPPFGLGLGLGLGRPFFDIAPEDRGPLRPGEADELLAFAKEHMPRVYDALSELKERNPRRFEHRAAEFAPRLRHLKRVFERSPAIGRLLRAHAENMLAIGRDAQVLRRERPDAPVYASALQAVRERVAENVRLEIAALRAAASELQENRAKWVELRTNELIQPDVDLSAAPEKLRDFAAQYNATTDEVERAALRERLAEGVAQRIDTELEAARQRASDLESNAAGEVDARVDRVLKSESRPGSGRGRPNRELPESAASQPEGAETP